MRSNTLLVALAATASASAVPQPRAEAPAPTITPGPIFNPAGLPVNVAMRQHAQHHGINKRDYMVSMEVSGKGNGFTRCINSINSVYDSISYNAPYPSDTDLASWIETALYEEPITTIPIEEAEKACETSNYVTPTPPASLASAYTSYEKEAETWLAEAAKGASSAVKDCPTKVRDFIQLTFETDPAQCKALVNKLKSGAASSSGKSYFQHENLCVPSLISDRV